MPDSSRVDFEPARRPQAPYWTSALAAASRADDPEPLIRPVLRALGFDGVSLIVLAPGSVGEERALKFWSTAPEAWSTRYREHAYANVDPRVRLTAHRLSPVIWDAADLEPDPLLRRFFADAARYGVRSGFAVAFRDATSARTVVTLDSAASPLSEARCAELVVMLGDLMLFAAALHERIAARLFGAPAVAAGNSALTQRERECLAMTAKGQTSGDIGRKLGIAERTVNFHMRNVLRKLGALNRPEAIAKALARGILDSTRSPSFSASGTPSTAGA